MTLLLALDTASPRFAIAVVEDGRMLATAAHEDPQEHSRALLATIDRLLRRLGRQPDRLAAVVGPGSYSGLRVGLATVQGLALARRLPVTGIGTLAAVAAAAGRPRVTAIHPIGRGEFAAQDFSGGDPAGPIYLARPEELPGPDTAGEGAGRLGGLELPPGKRCEAAARLAETKPLGDLHDLEAIYVREPSISRPKPPAPNPETSKE